MAKRSGEVGPFVSDQELPTAPEAMWHTSHAAIGLV
jgi:hypothetical protein